MQSFLVQNSNLSYTKRLFYVIYIESNLLYDMKKMKQYKGKLYAYKIEDYKMMKLARQKPLLFESILMLHCSNHDRNANFYHVTLKQGKAIVDAVRYGRNTFLSAPKNKGKVNYKLYNSLCSI